MIDEMEVKPRKILKARKRVGTEGCEGFVHDQFIIFPEIMTMILAKLNLRSLKQVRLVCKSWLREAGPHMEKRVRAVRFNRELSATRFPQFLEILAKKIPGLPQPFNSIDMDLTAPDYTVVLFPELAQQLSSLRPPLALTRFTPWEMPLELALPLIIKCSSSLEYLQLRDHGSSEADYSPLMDSKQQFLKLKRLRMNAISSCFWSRDYNPIRFTSIIAWIVKASPNLEKCVFSSGLGGRLTAQLLKQVEIRNVKELQFHNFPAVRLVVEPYLSIPFRQLQHLDIRFNQGYNNLEILRMSAQMVTHSANSLRKLVLHGFGWPEFPTATFPICPNVKELSIDSLVYSSDFLLQHFPSLKELNIYGDVDVKLDEGWSILPPLLGVKTLRIRCIMGLRVNLYSMERQIPDEVRFLEKCPRLERLTLKSFFLRYCCELKASEPLEYANLLAEVKHLVVFDGNTNLAYAPGGVVSGSDSWLAGLPGVETMSMSVFDLSFVSMAVKGLQNLRIIKFPWDDLYILNPGLDIKTLLEVTKGLEKVLITNCCSSPFSPSFQSDMSETLLKQFFELAPNAQCGCGSRGDITWGF